MPPPADVPQPDAGVHGPVAGAREPGAGVPEPLTGGNSNVVERIGDTVRRTGGSWTPTIHALLDHLRAHGVSWLPRPLGRDAEGRELLTFLVGTVPQYPMPPWIWTDDLLATAARRLAELHDASIGFDHAGPWQMTAHEPREVICHNDFAPYNFVFDGDHQLTGVIDCDLASPGPRVWDLAYLAYRLVPLTSPDNPGGLDTSLAERGRRLALLSEAYGAVSPRDIVAVAIDRLRDLTESTAQRAAAGATQLTAHVPVYVEDTRWLAAQAVELSDLSALSSPSDAKDQDG